MVDRSSCGRRAQALAASEADVLEAALPQFYEAHDPPPEIHVPVALPERALLEDWLAYACRSQGPAVRAAARRQARPARSGDAATRRSRTTRAAHDGSLQHAEALDTLRVALGLPALPRRIECFDISTIQGSETVASMVVCEDGRMRRSEYRKFRIRGRPGRAVAGGPARGRSPGPADTGTGHARGPRDPRRLRRRCTKSCCVAIAGPRKRADRFPTSIVIDGGKGQLSAAYDGAAGDRARAGSSPSASPSRRSSSSRATADDPIAFPRESPALRLLQRIRDEAHRFAVTFHRRARSKRDLRSGLDDVPGIGSRRRKLLLTRFGSLAGVRRATREELDLHRRCQGCRRNPCCISGRAHFR